MTHDVPTLKRFRKSPDYGSECICSLCGEPIYIGAVRALGYEDGESFELRFHWKCFSEFQEFHICNFVWGDAA